MYAYNDFDKNYVHSRVDEFREQVQRRIDGVLTEEELGQMQSTAPPGAVWGIDPTTGLVTAVYP